MGGVGERFYLVEVGGGGRGPNRLAGLYDHALDAAGVAERLLEALADVPHRRPFRVDVVDAWTRETVTSVRPGVPVDPDVCPYCGQPNDPFVAARGTAGDGTGVVLPSPVPSTGCDGEHGAPACSSPDCWQRDPDGTT